MNSKKIFKTCMFSELLIMLIFLVIGGIFFLINVYSVSAIIVSSTENNDLISSTNLINFSDNTLTIDNINANYNLDTSNYVSDTVLSSSDTGLDASNPIVSMNDPLSTLYIYSDKYYDLGQMSSIEIKNLDYIKTNYPEYYNQLYFEISYIQDSSYKYRYLGGVEEQMFFLPEKNGTYIAELIYTGDVQPRILSSKIIFVFGEKSCRLYSAGKNLEINFRNYDEYVSQLPSKLELMRIISGVKTIFLYNQEIVEKVDYALADLGKYILITDEKYLDCFEVLDPSDPTLIEYDSSINNNNTSLNFNNYLDTNYIINDFPVYVTETLPSFNETDYKIVDLKAFKNSKDIFIITLIESKTIINGDLKQNQIWLFKYDLNDYESFIIDENNNNISKNIALSSYTIIGYNYTSPSLNTPISIFGGKIFWLSEDGLKIFYYDLFSSKTKYFDIPYFDPSQGISARINISENSFSENSLDNNLTSYEHDAIIYDGSNMYFYKSGLGEIFSEDDSELKEFFRNYFSLDTKVSVETLSDINLEVD